MVDQEHAMASITPFALALASALAGVAACALGCNRPLEVEKGDVLLHASPASPAPPTGTPFQPE
jgi:hypothetical protein